MLFTIFVVAGLATPALAQDIATAVQVQGRAEMSHSGQRYLLQRGVRIPQGAVVATAADGVVHMTFDDGTNMVVGQNSQMEITEVLMASGNSASRFAVNAVAGGFRFISGNSAQEAYEIVTPTATMGVRGTQFDLAVERRRTTLALFTGSVEMCRGGNRCAIVRGSCAIARTFGFRGIRGVGGAEAADTLDEAFGFVTAPEQVLPRFRVISEGCDAYYEARRRAPVRPPPPRLDDDDDDDDEAPEPEAEESPPPDPQAQ